MNLKTRFQIYWRESANPRSRVLQSGVVGTLVVSVVYLASLILRPLFAPGTAAGFGADGIRIVVDWLAPACMAWLLLRAPGFIARRLARAAGDARGFASVSGAGHTLVWTGIAFACAALLQSAALYSLGRTEIFSTPAATLAVLFGQSGGLKIFWQESGTPEFARAVDAFLNWLQIGLALLATSALTIHLRRREIPIYKAFFNSGSRGQLEFATLANDRAGEVVGVTALSDGLRVLRRDGSLPMTEEGDARLRREFSMRSPAMLYAAVPPFAEIWTADLLTKPVAGGRPEAYTTAGEQGVSTRFDFPPSIREIFLSLKEHGNPYGLSRELRIASYSRPAEKESEASAAEFLLWTGPELPFADRGRSLLSTLATILDQAGVAFITLDAAENCTGYPARLAGNAELFRELRAANLKAIRASGVQRIITPCATSARAFREVYGESEGLSVNHSSEVVAALLSNGRIELDPVHVAAMSRRRAVLQHSPTTEDIVARRVLREMVGRCLGCDPREFPYSHGRDLRLDSRHVWEPGALEAYFPARASALIDSGADLIITTAPDWLYRLDAYINESQYRGLIQVLDVIEVVAASMKNGYGAVPGGFAETAGSL